MAHIETVYDETKDLTIHHLSGAVDGDELIDQIKDDLDRTPTRYVIWDFTDANMESLTLEKLRQVLAVGKVLADVRQTGKTALVMPQDLSYGLGRMYETLTEIERFATSNRSFRSIPAAMEWLGLSVSSETVKPSTLSLAAES